MVSFENITGYCSNMSSVPERLGHTSYLVACSVRPIQHIGEYSLIALQHRRIRYTTALLVYPLFWQLVHCIELCSHDLNPGKGADSMTNPIVACTTGVRSAVQRHQSPERLILHQICSLVYPKIQRRQVIMNVLNPSCALHWSPPVLWRSFER